MKSIFVSVYMTAAVMVSVAAGQSLWASGDFVSWGGVLLVSAPFVLVIGWLMIFRNVARTSARLPALLLLATAGVLLASWGYAQGGSPEAPLMAIGAWLGLVLYAYWYSSFNRQPSPQLEVGSMLPGFEVLDIAGRTVNSRSFNDRPTIWIFHRGNWCPLCMAQIKEVASQYRDIQAMGVRVALVSPQPHKYTIDLAQRLDVPFEFMTDVCNRAAKTLGIDQPCGLPMGMQVLGYDSDTVLPTVVITEKGGRIVWAHETDNYRVRPDPDIYLDVLRDKGLIVPAT